MYCFFHYFIDVKSVQARSYDGFTDFLLFSVLMSPSSSSSPPFHIVVFPYATLPHPLYLCVHPIFLPSLGVFSNHPLHPVSSVFLTGLLPSRHASSSCCSSAASLAPSSGGFRQHRSSCRPKRPTSPQRPCREECSSSRCVCIQTLHPLA